MAVVVLENVRVGIGAECNASLLQVLNNCAKRISFHTPRGTLIVNVEAKTIGSRMGDVGIVSLVIVSAPLATAYVAAYNVQMRPKGREKRNRPGRFRAFMV